MRIQLAAVRASMVRRVGLLLAVMAASVALHAQTTGGTSFRIERLDPALDES